MIARERMIKMGQVGVVKVIKSKNAPPADLRIDVILDGARETAGQTHLAFIDFKNKTFLFH